ncbi:MAG: polysaccharide deacetylase family protein [Gammaproteobacteria bacterium]|nr:polysaccharide deacetylase family protein [Gammaproteobacteria bacterium]
MPLEPGKAMAVVLHDVAPQTWPLYEPFVATLDALGPVPLTLLVVPDYHHRGALAAHPRFRTAIETRIARGDEVALHGYFHSDDRPLRPNPLDLLRRRLYTHEGEFAALDADEARRRLERGHALFAALGWPVDGFVAPAWLMNRAARAALADLPFRYTSDPAGLIRLPEWRPLAAPSLVWSARSAWRRRVSRHWNERRLRRGADQALIRLGLHPIDLRHGEVRAFWLRVIRELLPERRALTKGAWLRRAA